MAFRHERLPAIIAEVFSDAKLVVSTNSEAYFLEYMDSDIGICCHLCFAAVNGAGVNLSIAFHTGGYDSTLQVLLYEVLFPFHYLPLCL